MSAVRTDRPRNAGFNKERARVQYAQRRLAELRNQGVDESIAWETIGAEVKAGAAEDCGCHRATAMCDANPQCRVKTSGAAS